MYPYLEIVEALRISILYHTWCQIWAASGYEVILSPRQFAHSLAYLGQGLQECE